MSRANSPITTFRKFLMQHFSGTIGFDEIRDTVRTKFPSLCDDSKLCIHEFPRRAEWEHQLRHALDYLKNKQNVITQAIQGEYTFPATSLAISRKTSKHTGKEGLKNGV